MNTIVLVKKNSFKKDKTFNQFITRVYNFYNDHILSFVNDYNTDNKETIDNKDIDNIDNKDNKIVIIGHSLFFSVMIHMITILSSDPNISLSILVNKINKRKFNTTFKMPNCSITTLNV